VSFNVQDALCLIWKVEKGTKGVTGGPKALTGHKANSEKTLKMPQEVLLVVKECYMDKGAWDLHDKNMTVKRLGKWFEDYNEGLEDLTKRK
jgi:hypothetical protein